MIGAISLLELVSGAGNVAPFLNSVVPELLLLMTLPEHLDFLGSVISICKLIHG